ncbi:penicillin amidase [Rhodospirillum rubrum]|uniref:penicillin acylase family protein n=1 Tax=Rhodospirillum rubrum TaxID=1085 RepID=UPI0019049A79|nr:penicillin acylase family protein [Rhodospirillum rubrum]MBK1664157.1 penicillin amidase [Rhodospirillum rubrum]MBK1675822.1 penicillin amidase [Rhodospirillum rubrum]
MTRLGHWMLRLGLGAVALGLVAALVLGLALTGSLPRTSGRIEVATGGALPVDDPERPGSFTAWGGLSAPIDIIRDRYAIPTIRAANDRDAAFALGVVHAQDRLWQMEGMRRLGAGRMAELLGPRALPIDRFMRTLGLHALAAETYRRMPADERAVMEAYCAGVNQIIGAKWTIPPPEFLMLLTRPEPWRPADSLVWGRLMGLWLSADWQEELVRAALAKSLSPERLKSLWPAFGRSDVAARPAAAPLSGEAALALLAAFPKALAPTLASNAWAVGGDKTASGQPLLASDPHLGFQAPIQWYLARIETPDRTLTGATFPGVPLTVIGTNGHVAWGLTTTHSDTMDLFVERVVDADHYLTENGPEPWLRRTETIAVRGAPSETLEVRASRHGPVISDVLPAASADLSHAALGEGEALTLAATALRPDDQTALALRALNRARTADEVRKAARGFQSPQQNLIYATAEGAIGRLSPGLTPLRAGGPGLLPQMGWTSASRWTGYIPFDDLPAEADPASGFVYNTNSAIVGEDYPHYLIDAWPGEDRAARLARLLAYRDDHGPRDMALYQLDTVSHAMETLLPRLLDFPAALRPAGSAVARAHALLADPGWSFDMGAHRTEPLIATAWLVAVNRLLFAPAMGPAFAAWERLDPAVLHRALDGAGSWCDPAADAEGLTGCDRLKAQALAEALSGLGESLGGADPFTVTWGEVHRAHFRHPLFRYLPALAKLTTLETATGGDDFTLSRGSWGGDQTEPFGHVHGAGLRAVIDFATIAAPGFILATGQSGHPLSPHYRDMFDLWRRGDLITVDGADPSGGHLILEPVGDR